MTAALVVVAAVFCALACLVHLANIIATLIRCKARTGATIATPADAPAVTIIRLVCGIKNHVAETLESSFNLDYPEHEVLFCVASPKDPIMPTVAALQCKDPKAHAHLLVGDELTRTNRKLHSCAKGWKAAAHDRITIADRNVLMPRDYIQRLFEPRTEKTGLVCSPPIGRRPQGFSPELECAILNSYQARAEHCADAIGIGFAQGAFRPNLALNSSRLCSIH